MSKKRLVIANWKMYVEKPDDAKKFAARLKRAHRTFSGVDAWIAPGYTLLPTLAASFKGSTIKIGGQGVSQFDFGAHTGDISAQMLKASGASFSIVGHSERRAAGDTNDIVHKQLSQALTNNMTAVLCVGELERDQFGAHYNVIAEQLRSAFAGAQSFLNKIVIAYEPVWAIGKSADKAMAPQELEEMVIFIKKTLADIVGRTGALKIPILYGGSVEPENAPQLIAQGGVNGFLVGHASANVESFIEILKACRK
jgi:triosephosphate isomerase